MDNIAEKLGTEVLAFDKKLQDFINSSNEDMKAGTKLGRENAQKMDAINKQLEDMNAEMLDIQQHSRSGGGEGEPVLSNGKQFINSDAFADMKSGRSKSARIDMQNNTIVGADATVAPDRRAGVVGGAFRSLRVADIIPQGMTGSNAVEYTRELAFTDLAAEAAEAAQKAESAVTFELVNSPVRTIAHFIKLSKQIVDDAPMIASYVDGRMAYGVRRRYDLQLLNGDGTAPNLSGLRDTGNFTAFTPSGTDGLVSIREAITDVEQADYSPDAIILNPLDLQNIDLTKATTGEYVAADPRIANSERAWGLPIVVTNAMPAGQFMVGAFTIACESFLREGVTVEMFEQDSDNVQKNLITMRAEMRAALAVYRPASLVGGALST